jgi:hypothetical protein
MNEDPVNQFQLQHKEVNGVLKRAIMLRVEVPDGLVSWEDLGHKLLLYATHQVNQTMIDNGK